MRFLRVYLSIADLQKGKLNRWLFSFFFQFYGHTHSIWKYPGQGLNASHSCDLQLQQLRIL